MSEEFKRRWDTLDQQRQDILKKIEELEGKKKQHEQSCEVSDIDWCLDDNRWRLQDIEWEIRDTRWENTDRSHQRRTSVATFWTVLGAVLFAIASLVLSIGVAL